MIRQRPSIPRRRAFFLGCEGESEQAYGQFLNDLARTANLPVYIEVRNLSPGAGDPISRLQRAKAFIDRYQRNRTKFEFKAVLLDTDQIENDLQRRSAAERLAEESGISIIWQSPCHEALLVRHFARFAQRHPINKTEVEGMLRQVWPAYQKPMTRLQVAKGLQMEHVQRGARSDKALLDFLHRIGLF